MPLRGRGHRPAGRDSESHSELGYFKSDRRIQCLRAAGGKPVASNTSLFERHLLSTGDDAGSEAVGVWSVGTQAAEGNYLAGGFGAVREGDAAVVLPGTDDGTMTETTVVPSTMVTLEGASDPAAATVFDDGRLKLRGKKLRAGRGANESIGLW